ncbi:Spore germination GerAB [Acididesulfobacillus acetoxydans]|uniref:Spore germination GerAB n=1 Tax=Acididesulfobacillus acetoxydans TaxID=1561005 RepID=A0A8S0W786_9FIRM|nr:GerAB/ArcD/ProY family transporter [Acididesulfobacillus acetoxydans]CAA7600469.1 Spore germination GerAB [Acididesulfobacillus acetoxydans]CEJ06603.1 Spore germination protein [Acididesulfobacillus acetoxydans]
MQPGKLSKRQVMGLLLPFVLSTDVLMIPGAPLELARRGAWLSSLLATFLGVGLTFFIVKLVSWQPRLRVTERFRRLLGRGPGTITGLVFTLFIFFSYILVIREGSELVRISFLPDTPLDVITAGLTLVSMYGALLGMEAVSRFNILVFPFFLLSFILLFLAALSHPEWTNLWHPLQSGIGCVIAGAFAPLSWLGELVVIVFLIPDLSPGEQGTPFFLFFVTLGAGCLMTLNIVTIQISLGWGLGQFYTFPILQVGRSLFSRESLRGLDVLIMTLWVMGVATKLSFLLYYGLHEICHIFRVRNMKSLILPGGLLFQVLSLTSMDSVKELEYVTRYLAPFLALGTYEGIIPILLFPLILRYLKKEGGV